MKLLEPKRGWFLSAIALGTASLLAAACGGGNTAVTATRTVAPTSAPAASTSEATGTPSALLYPSGKRMLEVRQPEGKVVYWVLPGPRRIDASVFGIPKDPKTTGEKQIQEAQGPVKALLQQLPILVGIPLKDRATNPAGIDYTQTTIATPFSDKGAIISGSLDVTYIDHQPTDTSGDPTATKDQAKLSLKFTDPQGHHYEVKLLKVFMPPIPGWNTQGGVMIDWFHHGTTGTGSPLMPLVYTYGAFWGVGDVYIDGQLADHMMVTHCMTTNTVRDQNYKLAFNEELPLPLDKTIAGQAQHTHCIVLPVTITPQGPKYEPVKTAFKLPNGETQPFIHVMFEQDQLVQAKGFTPPQTVAEIKARYEDFAKYQASAARTVTVQAREFQFTPNQIEGRTGETLRITFENKGTIAHNLTIPGLGEHTPTIQPGQTAELDLTLPNTPGAYQFYCSVPGHKGAGMVGNIVVNG